MVQKAIGTLLVANFSTGKFYRKALPGKEPRFAVAVIGINTIGSMLKTIFNAAGIDDQRNISNHGLRATSASVMLEAGFSQRTVAIRTGHHSNALESYIRDSKATHLAVSAALEPINVDQNISSSSQLNLIEKKDNAITEEVETEEEDEDEEEDTAEKRIKAPKRKKDDDPIVIELRKGSKIIKIST
uniref:Tyr recombinase domain-containing protein n=1 Tax=Tetranychus urticae TaxID=32264 RepID=T1K3S8_TETUR